jgi:hypothetical protein
MLPQIKTLKLIIQIFLQELRKNNIKKITNENMKILSKNYDRIIISKSLRTILLVYRYRRTCLHTYIHAQINYVCIHTHGFYQTFSLANIDPNNFCRFLMARFCEQISKYYF